MMLETLLSFFLGPFFLRQDRLDCGFRSRVSYLRVFQLRKPNTDFRSALARNIFDSPIEFKFRVWSAAKYRIRNRLLFASKCLRSNRTFRRFSRSSEFIQPSIVTLSVSRHR